jgi:capsular polysaccharide biosynthesis protein
MDKEFNLIAALRILLKWKMPILVLVIISGIAASIVSVFVMDEYFLSSSTFYPTNQYVNDRSLIFNTQSGAAVEYFGNKSDVNRVITIANSEPLMDYIIDSFKLASHYKIDTTVRYWKTKLKKKFDKNYEAIKTEHDAVAVSIFDTDPKLAATMTNAVVDKIDDLNKYFINESRKKLYDQLSAQIVEQQKSVNAFVDTLAALAGLYKIKVSSASGTVVVEGNDVRAVQQYKALLSMVENAERELNNRINIKEQMQVAIKTSNSSLYIVEKAEPADRREKPVRWVVVVLTMLFTTFIALIGVLLIEQIKEIKAQL